MTGHVVDHDMGNRISYLISFFFVLLTFLFHFLIIFDQILDVQFSALSSPPSEARSPPPARRTLLAPQFKSVPCS
jgi:hypothetical protein